MNSRLINLLLSVLLLLMVMPCVNAESESDFTYSIDAETGEVRITGYTGTGGDVVIPAELEGAPVTVIGYRAFCECCSLTVSPDPNFSKYVTEHHAEERHLVGLFRVFCSRANRFTDRVRIVGFMEECLSGHLSAKAVRGADSELCQHLLPWGSQIGGAGHGLDESAK